MTEKPIWTIRAGETSGADDLFREKKQLALGWREMGDLSKLAPNRDAFKKAVAVTYPDIKPGAIPNYGGQLFRYVHELKTGDLVAYPSKLDRQIHFGEVTGKYRYDSSDSTRYPHRRAVKWLKSIPRTQFTQGALYEIGSAMTIFLLGTYADEFRAALSGQVAPAVGEDKTAVRVAADIEETTQDFILKTLSQQLKGHPFAEFVGQLLNTMGYFTRVSPPGPDRGVDIIAHRDQLGLEPPIIKVQVKSSDGASGDPEVSALYGKVGAGEYGLFMTLGTFTTRAIQFADSKANLRLIDGRQLIELILRHYEQLDAAYKGILPLKRVYIPEPIATDESV